MQRCNFQGIRYDPEKLLRQQAIWRRALKRKKWVPDKLLWLANQKGFIESWWHPESKGGWLAKKDIENWCVEI